MAGHRPTIPIERGIPLPPAGSTANRGKFPWHEMEVGDSFFCPEHVCTPKNLASQAAGIGRTWGLTFRTRREPGGIRCWLVEKPEGYMARRPPSSVSSSPPPPGVLLPDNAPAEREACETGAPSRAEPPKSGAALPRELLRGSDDPSRAVAEAKRDTRRARNGWEPGSRWRRCEQCFDGYEGSTRSIRCADCAYGRKGAP